ncbi:hypothetical protein QUF63_16475 [Anaerolineales bacterium HSG25]|nr:hypothetical protein [Anaerolineales bacterium HSG25]
MSYADEVRRVKRPRPCLGAAFLVGVVRCADDRLIWRESMATDRG